jgi:flagellar biosynthesis/type III secretory pathway protein FliH
MATVLKVKLSHPVRAVRWAEAEAGAPADASAQSAARDSPSAAAHELQRGLAEVAEQQQRLEQACRFLDDLTTKFSGLYEEIVGSHRKEIARLAVEIARKVLAQKVQQGDYEVEGIVQEALDKAPVKQGVTIHVNPQDWEVCQQLRQKRPDSPWSCLAFVADPSLGRAQCLIETSRGVVKSLIEERLDKIQRALEKTGS